MIGSLCCSAALPKMPALPVPSQLHRPATWRTRFPDLATNQVIVGINVVSGRTLLQIGRHDREILVQIEVSKSVKPFTERQLQGPSQQQQQQTRLTSALFILRLVTNGNLVGEEEIVGG